MIVISPAACPAAVGLSDSSVSVAAQWHEVDKT